MDKIIVGIAEGKVARENQVLISYALGSCVGVCLYDPRERIAGMAHIILPGRKYSAHWDNAYKFADEGIHELMNQMREQGARPADLIAKDCRGRQNVWPVVRKDGYRAAECRSRKGKALLRREFGW